MKTNRIVASARIVVALASIGAMTACVPVYRHAEPAPYYAPRVVAYDYWYYPAIGTYYDPRARVYIYYEHNHWIRARVLPVHVRPYIGHYVTVRTAHDHPYDDFYKHREQYAPERYRKPDPSHHDKDIWLGAPRQQAPQHDDRGKGKDKGKQEHDSDRGRSDAPQYRGSDSGYQWQAPSVRSQDVVSHRETPGQAAPMQRVSNNYQQQDMRREEPRERASGGKLRRENDAQNDTVVWNSRTGQPVKYRPVAAHDLKQSDKTHVEVRADNTQSSTDTLPAKRQDKKQDKKPEQEGANQNAAV